MHIVHFAYCGDESHFFRKLSQQVKSGKVHFLNNGNLRAAAQAPQGGRARPPRRRRGRAAPSGRRRMRRRAASLPCHAAPRSAGNRPPHARRPARTEARDRAALPPVRWPPVEDRPAHQRRAEVPWRSGLDCEADRREMVLGDILSRSATVTELCSRRICVRTSVLQEHCHGTFTEIYIIKLQFSQQWPIHYNPRVST
jgi:hypothetical protein